LVRSIATNRSHKGARRVPSPSLEPPTRIPVTWNGRPLPRCVILGRAATKHVTSAERRLGHLHQRTHAAVSVYCVRPDTGPHFFDAEGRTHDAIDGPARDARVRRRDAGQSRRVGANEGWARERGAGTVRD